MRATAGSTKVRYSRDQMIPEWTIRAEARANWTLRWRVSSSSGEQTIQKAVQGDIFRTWTHAATTSLIHITMP